MISGVQDINYNVSHMQRAIKFYTEALGMEVIKGDEHWTTLSCNGVHVGLHWTGGDQVVKVVADEHGAAGGGTLTLKSSDVSADRSVLESKGATIIGEMNESWGDLLVFEDPDGNILKLMHPKH